MKSRAAGEKVTSRRPSGKPAHKPTQVELVFAEFLRNEIGDQPVRPWAEKRGLPKDLGRRYIQCERAIGLDKLQQVADAVGLEPWQAIFPGFRRGPALEAPTLSAELIAVASQIETFPPEQRPRVYALIAQAIELARSAAPQATQPVEPPKPAPESMRAPARRR